MPHTSPAIVVVGSINADLSSFVKRHPQPGETIHGTGGTITPGGKGANQAVAAANLGAHVAMVGAVGTDPNAEPALSGLTTSGTVLDHVARVDGPTGLAIVTVSADGENTIVVIPGANGSMDAQAVEVKRDVIASAHVVVAQGEIPRDGIEALPTLVTGRFLFNPAPVLDLSLDTFRAADPLVVNEHEATLVAEQFGHSPTTPQEAAQQLLGEGVASIVLTLGANGSVVYTPHGDTVIAAVKVTAVDTTGAGDAFIGALAATLADGNSLEDAARFASRVGAYAVTGTGAQPSYPTTENTLPS